MQPPDIARGQFFSALEEGVMVPKSDHLANTRFDKKPSAHNQDYLASTYATAVSITTVGYGDVLATTIPEYALMIIIMFVGGFMWAYIIGAVCAVTATLDIKKIEQENCLH